MKKHILYIIAFILILLGIAAVYNDSFICSFACFVIAAVVIIKTITGTTDN